jgi:hypothetical protein
MSLVMQEMLRCLDTSLKVLAFAKNHRPEERAERATAETRLRDLRVAYPASWRLLQRRLGNRQLCVMPSVKEECT